MAVTKSNNLRFGSRGDDVYELQRLLNNNGYGLDLDGKYGEKTQAAVRDYQTKNSLVVDGVVGTNTWGKLNTVSPPKPVQNTTPNTPTAPKQPTQTQNQLANIESSKPNYQQSDAVKNAQDILSQWEQNKPGDYQSAWNEQIQGIWDKIQNREFDFTISGNPLYEQYKDQYIQNGKLAMQDYMAQNAALSGGYGTSWGATAGNLANQEYLSKLNDVIPDLYQQEYSKYRDEGTDMYNQMNSMMSMDQADYGKYRDEVGDYYTQLQYLANKADTMSKDEYNKFLNDLNAWQADRGYYYGKNQDEINLQNYLNEIAYGKEQDALSQSNWQKEFDSMQQQYLQSQSNWDKQFAYQKEQDIIAERQNNLQIDYQQQKDSFERKLTIAQLAAQQGDFSKLKSLGINIDNAMPEGLKTAMQQNFNTFFDLAKKNGYYDDEIIGDLKNIVDAGYLSLDQVQQLYYYVDEDTRKKLLPILNKG